MKKKKLSPVEEIKSELGTVCQEHEGSWQSTKVQCNCGGHVPVEIDVSEDGGYLGENHVCDTCKRQYKAAYRMHAEIKLEEMGKQYSSDSELFPRTRREKLLTYSFGVLLWSTQTALALLVILEVKDQPWLALMVYGFFVFSVGSTLWGIRLLRKAYLSNRPVK